MMRSRFPSVAAPIAAIALALLAACGGSSAKSSGGIPGTSSALHVLSCTLGCSGPIDGTQSCTITEVFENQTIAFEFNRSIDPSSVTSSSLRVTKLSTGQVASGFLTVDPSNPRRVTYRPSVSLNGAGEIVPGFEPNVAYRVFVRGSGTGAKIHSLDGSSNITTIECYIVASKGILDLQPGPPSASVFVEELDPQSGQPTTSYPADGATDVPLRSRVRIDFDQIMDAQTLIDLVDGTSPSVSVRFDDDGDPNTSSDQVALPGIFGLDFDQVLGRTRLVFLPQPTLPSAGIGLNAHRVVVRVQGTAADISGALITEPVAAVFTPVAIPIPPQLLIETFQNDVPIAIASSSAIAQPAAILPGGSLRGRVLPGVAGGSGRLGELMVRAGETLVLGTGPDVVSRFGSTLNSGAVDIFGVPTVEEDEIVAYQFRTAVVDNYVDDGEEPGEAIIEVDDGVFEFSALIVEAGGVLTFQGANAPRLFVRGKVEVLGTVDLSGRDGEDHVSTDGFGGRVGTTRAGGGAGGNGGDRPDQPDGSQMLPTQGPSYRGFNHQTGAVVNTNGGSGEGRGGAAPATVGGGGGGMHWPTDFPGPFVTFMGTLSNASYLNILCASVIVGAPGAGGTFASLGKVGTYATPAPSFGVPPPPPVAPISNSIATADAINLDPDTGGDLVGGSGGGGGGAGVQGTTTNGSAINNCIPPGPFPIKQITGYLDGSGAAGGSGGGALQLQSGVALELTGLFDLSGGKGGGLPLCLPTTDSCWSAPGGGGSGGALLLQAPLINFISASTLFKVSGGIGGSNLNTLSTGGAGGVGVVELRSGNSLTQGSVLSRLVPPLGGVGQPLAIDVLDIGSFVAPTSGTGVYTGFNTCWSVPTAGLFGFDFVSDDFSSSDPSEWVYSWNAKIELNTGEIVDWRGDSGSITVETGLDFATLAGTELGSAPLVVRFQGVRANGPIQSPCTFDPLAPFSVAEPDSLTPWFVSTGELNTYWAGVVSPELAEARRANAFRAQFVFDPTAPFADRIVSIAEFRVVVQPR